MDRILIFRILPFSRNEKIPFYKPTLAESSSKAVQTSFAYKFTENALPARLLLLDCNHCFFVVTPAGERLRMWCDNRHSLSISATTRLPERNYHKVLRNCFKRCLKQSGTCWKITITWKHTSCWKIPCWLNLSLLPASVQTSEMSNRNIQLCPEPFLQARKMRLGACVPVCP